MPEALPPGRQVETLTNYLFEELVGDLSSRYERYGTFVDSDFILEYPSLLVYMEYLSSLLSSNKDDEEEIYRTVQESFHFAYRAANSLMPGDVRVSPPSYISKLVGSEVASEEDIVAKLIGRADEYLEQRPFINTLVGGFSDRLDSTQKHHDIADIVAAITFDQVEENERQAYTDELLSIEGQVLEFAKKLDELSGLDWSR